MIKVDMSEKGASVQRTLGVALPRAPKVYARELVDLGALLGAEMVILESKGMTALFEDDTDWRNPRYIPAAIELIDTGRCNIRETSEFWQDLASLLKERGWKLLSPGNGYHDCKEYRARAGESEAAMYPHKEKRMSRFATLVDCYYAGKVGVKEIQTLITRAK